LAVAALKAERSTPTLKENMMTRLLVIIAVVLAVTGCNTMSGAGKDVEAGGRAIEKAADDTKKKM
jgi:predicted small secreted protein